MNSIQYACSVIEIEGNILEFGVFKGDTIRQIKDLRKEKIFGFDSFEGLPETWEGTVCSKGFFSTNGNIPDIKDVTFFAGWFEDTIPKYLENQNANISLLHVDCDLYTSTKTVLYSLNDYIKNGTIICFDEWVYTKTDGKLYNDHEQKCFYEWIKDNNRDFEFIEFNDNTLNGHERKIVRIIK